MSSKKAKTSLSMKQLFSNNFFVLKALFKATPIYGVSVIVEAIRHNLINFLEQTICVFIILDAIETGKSYKVVVIVVLLFLALDFVAAAISNFYEQSLKLKYLPIAKKHLKLMLYEKARKVDLSCYDDTAYYNDFVLVMSEADRAIDRAENLVRMFFASITLLICYGSFVLTQDMTSILFVFGSFVLRTLFSNLLNKWNYKVRMESVPLERKREYVKRIFYLKKYAKDMRLNKEVSQSMHEEFDKVNDELYALNKRLGKRRVLLSFVAKYIMSDFLLDIVYVVYLVIKAAVYHALSFSGVVVLYNSAAGLRRGFSTVVDLGPYAVETGLYVEKIRSFLNYETKIKNEKLHAIPDTAAELEFRNVSFGYTKDKLILNGINLKISSKEKIALVGYNGAGKTTFIKLLLRLYDPTEGEILLNGVNIKEYDIEEYRNFIGIVFQDFQMFAADIAENVVMDNVDYAASDVKEKILKAINMSGFMNRYETLPDGLKTQLTQEFDDNGVDLSGGEEQKLAVARAFYKGAGMLLLDEPSSALDPIAEYHLNATMNKMAEDKMVIYISHRLSTTRLADRIYVLEEGRIVQSGTHEELAKSDGVYAKMWDVQARRYH